MKSMDNVCERFEALEQQTEQLKHETQALKAHTYMVERRLRWWQGIACGVMLLGLVSMPLQSGTAADTQPGAMAERMTTLENKLGSQEQWPSSRLRRLPSPAPHRSGRAQLRHPALQEYRFAT
jgi:hypothetical protein